MGPSSDKRTKIGEKPIAIPPASTAGNASRRGCCTKVNIRYGVSGRVHQEQYLCPVGAQFSGLPVEDPWRIHEGRPATLSDARARGEGCPVRPRSRVGT